MKKLNKTELSLIIIIISIIFLFGKRGIDFLNSLNKVIPIYGLAFSGLISFFIVAIIMYIAKEYYDIWIGKKLGVFLYAVICIIVSLLFI